MPDKPLIEFITTGSVKMRAPMGGQPADHTNRLMRLLRCFTGAWTPWLPLGAFLVRHADGPILVDTGCSPQCTEPGYFPWYAFLTPTLTQLRVDPDGGIVHQLAKLGVRPADLQAVVLTHLHHDHAGGLADIVREAPDVPVYVSADQWATFGTSPTYATLQGCAAAHWPPTFNRKLLRFGEGDSGSSSDTDSAIGPWTRSEAITKDGQVRAVETPGHMPGHISVIVQDSPIPDPLYYFLTGDATYSLDLLEREEPDGITGDPQTARQSLQKIKAFARQSTVVVLPNHDVQTPAILKNKTPYTPAAEAEAEH